MTDNFKIIFKGPEGDYLVVSKPGGIPAVPDKTGDRSLLEMVQEKFKRKLYPVHRIDRPVSGLVVFAGSKQSAAKISEAFRDRRVRRLYLAATESRPEKDLFELKGWIKKSGSRNRSFFSTDSSNQGKPAKATIKYLDSIDNYHLLGLVLESGRHHQIRAMLQFLECPVKGDVKYGARRKNKDRSIHLHAWKLILPASLTAFKIGTLTAELPSDVVWQAFDLQKALEGTADWEKPA
ncbi:MAG: RNA pseudouridine synthase [Saprospirales bacterium]|nr:MAG: RNA pseudouridine synthase [Saprospirales bacterium]